MAEDGLAFRFFDHDEMIFKGDDAEVRDASLHLMREVGYDASIQDIGKALPEVQLGDAIAMIGGPTTDDLGSSHLAEGADFFLF